MRLRVILAGALSLASFSAQVAFAEAQRPITGRDGAILDQSPCEFGSYDQQSGFTKQFYARRVFEAAKADRDVSCFRIKYWSDGLRVVGYLVHPRNTSTRFPVIIFNRGGFLNLGKIEAFNLIDLERLSKQGFVVLASQYRGNDGGDGREQLGGQDLDDVSNLLNTSKTLPYADTANVFMYGVSRGGMMTFLEMKNGFHINAAAVVGAVYDLAAFRERAPDLVDNAAQLIPEYSAIGISALKERSVMDWPETVNAPLLMIHGTDDEEVPVTEALAFATKLSNLHKTYELIVYAGDVHEAAKNRIDRDARIAAWFKSYVR